MIAGKPPKILRIRQFKFRLHRTRKIKPLIMILYHEITEYRIFQFESTLCCARVSTLQMKMFYAGSKFNSGPGNLAHLSSFRRLIPGDFSKFEIRSTLLVFRTIECYTTFGRTLGKYAIRLKPHALCHGFYW